MWCSNNQHSSSHQLGREAEYGIFKAEFVGLIHALKLAKHSILHSTRQVTIVLHNQGVVRDMSHKKTLLSALTHKTMAVDIINSIEAIAPHINIALHEGVEGNKRADQLATSAAKKPLPKKQD